MNWAQVLTLLKVLPLQFQFLKRFTKRVQKLRQPPTMQSLRLMHSRHRERRTAHVSLMLLLSVLPTVFLSVLPAVQTLLQFHSVSVWVKRLSKEQKSLFLPTRLNLNRLLKTWKTAVRNTKDKEKSQNSLRLKPKEKRQKLRNIKTALKKCVKLSLKRLRVRQ